MLTLEFKRKYIYPFRWFYQSHIWGFWFRVRCVIMFADAVWHWDSCDYSPTVRLMEIAFRRMMILHRDHGCLLKATRTAKQLLIVSELCKRIQEDNYADLAGHANYDSMSEFQRTKWARHTNYLQKQDVEYLGKMMRYLPSWWD